MKKEKFNASKLTRKDLKLIDEALCEYYCSDKHLKKDKEVLLIKWKIERLLVYGEVK